MLFLKPASLVFVSTLVICAIALLFKTDSIETDLTSRVTQELGAKGYGWAIVKLDGRNVTLEGTAPNVPFKATASELAETVLGVHRVGNNMEVTVKTASQPDEPAPVIPGSISDSKPYKTEIIFNEGRIMLKGSVPSPQLKKDIVRLSASLVPGARIIDDLIVNTNSPNNWRTVFGLGFSQVSRLKTGKMTLENNMLYMSGQAWSGRSIGSIHQILYAGLPDPYLAELTLKPLPPGSRVARAECQSLVNHVKGQTRIFFDTDSARIKRKSYPLLDRLSYTLHRCPEHKVKIEGHTDNKGPGARNWRLSKDRAESVKAYLVEAGLQERRIFTIGRGESRPIASNKEPAGRALNRRIELIVTNRRFVQRTGVH